jgi:hypothetical protein
MDRPLVVLLGAGASKDAASPDANLSDELAPPPLANELFGTPWGDILRLYPRVQAVAPLIRDAMKGLGEAGEVRAAQGLEDFLRTAIKESPHEHLQAAYRQIPFYLQHVLYRVSEDYGEDPDNYFRLVHTILASVRRVEFVTLNYDTLLDRALTAVTNRPFDSIGAYVAYNWSLTKLHGSINWNVDIAGSEGYGPSRLDLVAAPGHWETTATRGFIENFEEFIDDHGGLASLTVDNARIEVAGPEEGLTDMRGGDERRLRYPALAVPLGPDDTLICPEQHRDHLARSLRERDTIDLLVIGYSGLDQQVLSLFARSERELGHLAVICRDQTTSNDAAQAIESRLGPATKSRHTSTTWFNRALRAGEIHKFLDRLQAD